MLRFTSCSQIILYCKLSQIIQLNSNNCFLFYSKVLLAAILLAVNVTGGSIGYAGHYDEGYADAGYDGGHEGGYGHIDGGHISGNEIGTGHEEENYHVSQLTLLQIHRYKIINKQT